MHTYELDLPAAVSATLSAIKGGVVRIGVSARATGTTEIYGGLQIALATGEVISIHADEEMLQPRFEVFPITAASVAHFSASEVRDFQLAPPIEVYLLRTQDWLDPGIVCEGALGSSPMMQCQGAPGQAPQTALAACTYVGGIKVRDGNGTILLVTTLPSPFAISVNAFYGEADLSSFTEEPLNAG
jgi:hypothetical protein